MGIEQALAVEAEHLADQTAEGRIRGRLEGRKHGAEEGWQVVRFQREPGHDPEAAPTTAFDRPEQVRWVQALAIRTAPSAVTISASSRLAAARP